MFFIKKIYVVNMLRYGSRENHSYILSAYTTMQKAYDAAEEESNNRGGKYEYEIIEIKPNTKHGREKYLKSFLEPCNMKCKNDCYLKKYIKS